MVRHMRHFIVDTVQDFPSLEDFRFWRFKMFQVCHNFEANVAMNMFNWAQARRDVSFKTRHGEVDEVVKARLDFKDTI